MMDGRALRRMILPLFLEQLLVALVGLADVFVLGCWWVCEKIIDPFLKKNLPIDREYDSEELKHIEELSANKTESYKSYERFERLCH